MDGVSHMSQNEKFAAVELAKAGLGQKHEREKRGTSKEGIMKIVQKVRRQVTPKYLESLYQSMPRRMQAVDDAQGAHTRY